MFVFEFLCCFYVVICVLFDCKCKSLKRLGENITTTEINRTTNRTTQKKTENNRNTVYPAHEPPRINHTNYSRRFVGWISCIYVVVCFFLELLCLCVCFFMSFVLCFRLVFLSVCIYNRKTHITKNKTNKL